MYSPTAARGYEEREKWAADNGGVRAVQVTVTGNADQPVLLTNLRVNVVERRPPLSGTHVTYGPIGKVIPERFVAVDLDEQPPAITGSMDDRTPADSSLEPDPINFPYRVGRGDIEVFHLYVTTTTCDCEWNAEVSYSLGDQHDTITIQDGDQPFMLTYR